MRMRRHRFNTPHVAGGDYDDPLDGGLSTRRTILAVVFVVATLVWVDSVWTKDEQILDEAREDAQEKSVRRQPSDIKQFPDAHPPKKTSDNTPKSIYEPETAQVSASTLQDHGARANEDVESLSSEPRSAKSDVLKTRPLKAMSEGHHEVKSNPAVFKEQLISAGRPASSDVRGNLGPARVVTSEVVKDWLKDRWQAAKNMKGEPIPGPHWIEVDLGRSCTCSRFVIDFETAHSEVKPLYLVPGPGRQFFDTTVLKHLCAKFECPNMLPPLGPLRIIRSMVFQKGNQVG